MERRRFLSCGFTILEILIASAIVAGLSLVLAAALRMGQRSWQAGETSMTVSNELRRGIDAMSRELAQTRTAGLSIPADGLWYAALTFQVPQDLDGNGTVFNAASTLEWSNPVTYSLLNNQARRVQNAQTRILANGVTALQFRRLAASPLVLEMRMTVQRGSTRGGFINQDSLNTRVRLRN